MKYRIIVLGIICSLLINLCFCKKTPTSPDTSNIVKNPPVINSFTASPSSIILGEFSTLSWSVSKATQITIDQGIGGVSASGTKEVSPTETTTYTLTASNNDGQVSRAVSVEIKMKAILDVTLTPIPVLWVYVYPGWYATFTIIITESNGVGAQLNTVSAGMYLLGVLFNEYTSANARIEASGTFEVYCYLLYSSVMLDQLRITIKGADDNGYIIDETWVSYVYWTGRRAQMGMPIRIK